MTIQFETDTVNLRKILFLSIMLWIMILCAQSTKIIMDIKGNYSTVIETKDMSMELTDRGKLIDFDAVGQISYDSSGRPVNIGTTQVAYETGRITGIGSTQLNYDFTGRLISIGTALITYDLHGKLTGIGSTQIAYDIGRVISIGSTQIAYDWPGRVISGGNFRSAEGILFKFKCYQ